MSKENQIKDGPEFKALDESELNWIMEQEDKRIAKQAPNTLVKGPVEQEPPTSQLVESELVTDKPQLNEAEQNPDQSCDDENSAQEVDMPIDKKPKDHPIEALGE